jgi:hypothetical protein
MFVLLGIFKDRSDPDAVTDQLVERGVSREKVGVVWREKIVHTEEEVEVVTYVDHFDGPAIEAKKGAWGGLLGGAATGAATALLASAGIVLGPGMAAILGTGTAVAVAAAAAAGAASGSVAGGAIGALLGATDHDATKITTREVEAHDDTETDGFVITIDADKSEMPYMVETLTNLGATDITALGGEGSRLRSPIE